MRKLSITTFLTLDGVMQAPGGPDEDRSGGFEHGGWVVPLFTEDVGQAIDKIFEPADAFLLGRHTYEIFAASWPHATDQGDPVATKLNTLPKYVASTSLREVEWQNSRLIEGDVAEAVAKLKGEPGGEIQVHGSGILAQTLMKHGLIDEYHLLVFPVVLGSGRRLFSDGAVPSALQLTDTKTSSTGVLINTYRSAGQPTYGSMEVE